MKKYNIKLDCKNCYEEDIMNAIYEERGINDIKHFLNPVEDDLLPLNQLKNIDKFTDIVVDAIEENKCIGILADVDTDGVTSGTILTRYLKNYTDNVYCVINQGKSHGLIGQDLSRFDKADVVIIVDSLDKNTSQYEKLVNSGKQVCVLDHHKISDDVDYDSVVTLVSSQRDYDNKYLSGAGVVWKCCKYLDLITLNDFADEYVDLAACGILADVMDVSEDSYENRYIVYTGLKNQTNPAIKKILGGYTFNSKSVLFSISPLINACMRCGDNEVALQMFLSDDNKELLSLKKKLESYKEIQVNEVERLQENIHSQLEKYKSNSVVLLKLDTEYGIGGLIGNSVLNTVNRPLIILIGEDKENYYGSMRSIGTDDFRQMIDDTKLAQAFGHENASGVVIPKNNLDEFMNVISDEVSKINLNTTENVNIDAEIEINDVTRSLVDKVADFNFVSGNGNKPLTFKVVGTTDYEVSSFKQGKHLVLKPDDYHMLIEWNTDVDYDDMSEHSIMGDEVVAYCELEGGFFGRNYVLKCIMSDYEVG